MAYSLDLVSTLGAFVAFSVAIFAYQGLRHRIIYLGFSNLLIYAGAIAVLFVFVVLLVESQHVRLGSSDITLAGGSLARLIITGSSLIGGLNLAVQPLTLSPMAPVVGSPSLAALGSLAYGEHAGILFVTGLALVISTAISITTSLP